MNSFLNKKCSWCGSMSTVSVKSFLKHDIQCMSCSQSNVIKANKKTWIIYNLIIGAMCFLIPYNFLYFRSGLGSIILLIFLVILSVLIVMRTTTLEKKPGHNKKV